MQRMNVWSARQAALQLFLLRLVSSSPQFPSVYQDPIRRINAGFNKYAVWEKTNSTHEASLCSVLMKAVQDEVC